MPAAAHAIYLPPATFLAQDAAGVIPSGGRKRVEWANLDMAFSVGFTHRLRCTRQAWLPANRTLADLLDPPGRCVVFVDSGVAGAWPRLVGDERPGEIARYAGEHADRMTLVGGPHVVPGGERIKNDRDAIDDVLRHIEASGLCRRSYVIAVGGGAVLDAVGFAAAVAHRGVRLIRVPTTTLSQADSGVGVKNGINAFGKKNYIGTFAPPWAVVNDESLLSTLADRDWRAGFSEAVKVGLVKDAGLFEMIAAEAERIAARDESAAIPVIRRSAEIHLRHIVEGGDPFEQTRARPLDFGHWAAHRLEAMTGFELRHGEAVAIGIALDATYARAVGLMDGEACEAALACLESLGFELDHPALEDEGGVLLGLEEFREHLGGELTVTLATGIGESIDVHEIDAGVMRESMRVLVRRRARVGARV